MLVDNLWALDCNDDGSHPFVRAAVTLKITLLTCSMYPLTVPQKCLKSNIRISMTHLVCSQTLSESKNQLISSQPSADGLSDSLQPTKPNILQGILL